MIAKTLVHTDGKYSVLFNSQINAYNPYSVINTETGKIEFTYKALDVCLDYISDNLRDQNEIINHFKA
jgi:hypothetical protein